MSVSPTDTAAPATSDASSAQGAAPPGLLQLLRQRAYMCMWSSRSIGNLAQQVESIALAWHVYAIARLTGDVNHAAFAVGMVGLAQFLPMFALALIAGDTADRYDRRMIMAACSMVELISALCFAALAYLHVNALWPIYSLAVVFGVARAFYNPAVTALAPALVSRSLLPRAVAFGSLGWQSGAIVGPALGGLLIAGSTTLAFGVASGLFVISLAALLGFRAPRVASNIASRWVLMKEGLAYLWVNKIVLGAISLDLFAVLLGGATALLPVYARDILHVGGEGFGVLRAAPAVGALVVGSILATRPIRSGAGIKMFLGVGLFGLATVVFAVSRSMILSAVMLALLGAGDMISVFVRQSLVQITTPDAMRGRVAAVSTLFVGASNELGEFETGVVARLMGPIGATLFGGLGSLVVTGTWAWIFPDLRKADRLG